MQLFLDSTQSKLNFKPSFVGIHEVLRELWLFKHKFQARNFANFEFLGVSNLSKLFIKLINFIRISS